MFEGESLRDLTGQRFGRLTVLYRDETVKNRHAHWVCECDCGAVKTIRSDSLLAQKKGQNTRSCGCLARDERAARARSGEFTHRSHGCAPHNSKRPAEYRAWIKARETYDDVTADFVQFYHAIGPKPESPKTKLCRLPDGAFTWKPRQNSTRQQIEIQG